MRHRNPATHQFIVGDKKTPLDFIPCEIRRLTFILVFEFLITLKNHVFIFVRGMPEIAEDISSDEVEIKNILETLMESGLVEAAETGKGHYYILSSKVYRNADNTVGYVRQTGIDKIKYFKLVLKLAQEQGQVNRGDVIKLLNITGPIRYNIFRKLEFRAKKEDKPAVIW